MQSTGGGRSGSPFLTLTNPCTFMRLLRRLEHITRVHQYLSLQVPYRPAVEVTSMSYLPNTQIEQYLGNINLFLIRESHTVREVTKILDLPSCIFYCGRTREVYNSHVNCFSRLRVVPIFPEGQQSERNATARENHPTRLSRVGKFSHALAFRSLQSP